MKSAINIIAHRDYADLELLEGQKNVAIPQTS